MEELRKQAQQLKGERSKLKCKVTCAAKKLSNAINANCKLSSLQDLLSNVEQFMQSFESIHEEYCTLLDCNEGLDEFKTVNGLDLDEYYEGVSKTYQEVKLELGKLTKCENELKQEHEVVRSQVEHQIRRLRNLCDRTDELLKQGSPDVRIVECHKQDLRDMLRTLDNMMPALYKMESDERSEQDAAAIDVVCRADDVVRQCDIVMHLSSGEPAITKPEVGSALDSKSPQSPGAYSNNLGGNTSADPPISSAMPPVAVSTSSPQIFVPNSDPQQTPIATNHTQGVSPASDHGVYTSSGLWFPTTTQAVHNLVSSTQSVPFSGQSYTPTNVHESQFSTNPPRNSLGNIRIEKTSLPVFSGKRSEWPEFQAVWRELAESNIRSSAALAYELKRCLKGKAWEKVKNVYVTRPDAYDLIWQRLKEFYDDTSACVQSALDGLGRLKHVREDDYVALVHLVDSVESVHSQLLELGQTSVLSMREVDRVSELLPSSVKMLWNRTFYRLDVTNKLHPYDSFMKFFYEERASVVRLAEGSRKSDSSRGTSTYHSSINKASSTCVIHGDCKHKTKGCKEFAKLPLDDKYQALRKAHACFKCFELHRRENCPEREKCKNCAKDNHNTLMCRKPPSTRQDDNQDSISASFHASQSKHCQSSSSPTERGSLGRGECNAANDSSSLSLYAIQQVFVLNSGKWGTVFCDGGSNTSYITHRAAERLKAKKRERFTLDVTTMGNVSAEYDTRLYELSIRTQSGKVVDIMAFGMDEITGPVAKLDMNCISRLFPDHDVSLLQRKSTQVDVLLGCDYFGLHPKREVASSGNNLSIMQGDLGVCLQGSHPELVETTTLSSHLAKTVHCSRIKVVSHFVKLSQTHAFFDEPSREIITCDTMYSKTEDALILKFVDGEELGTAVSPKCGGCKCAKCPILGHTYSFKEEQELDMIRSNLVYNEEQQHWSTSYPWLVPPGELPDNYNTALATLKSTELTLSKDLKWQTLYCEQMQDMLDRGVARKLSESELVSWDGPFFYISHLAVHNSHSRSTPVRIVFNSSQISKGVSLNSVLAKGPDSYLNNLLGLLLRWREEPVAVVGDIKKMFHSVHLQPLEQHCHRFLWRGMDSSREPDVFVMTRVNMGDRPAPAICSEALYKTAELFREDCPRAAELIKSSTYVDDIIDSFPDKGNSLDVIGKAELMLAKGGFQVKCWQFSGDSGPVSAPQTKASALLKGDDVTTRVLGVGWIPERDVISHAVVLNFSAKRRGEQTGPNLKASDLPQAIPLVLTRRMVLEQVMMVFDPLGLLCPFTILGKVYLRETWALRLGWDDPLPDGLRSRWIRFFSQMFQLESLTLGRQLRPSDLVGKPWLVLFSDGSDTAFGFAAYIRWKTQDGRYWCRLIMAKSRIAPINKLTTPQMELNGAVLSKRGRQVICKEMRFDFERILHVVDSETVLNMLNKVSTRFKLYEGVRIGEIQGACGGDMFNWAWVRGKSNPADLLTRGCAPDDLVSTSEWWNGPPFLYEDVSKWGLKFGLQKEESVPGEKKVKIASCAVAQSQLSKGLLNVFDFSRYSQLEKLLWVVARILSMFRSKSFGGGRTVAAAEHFQQAEILVLGDVQRNMADDFQSSKGRYASLKPVKGDSGLWVVGSRLKCYNPMTPENEPQILLPPGHAIASLFMEYAHRKGGHRGRDSTLSRFRQRFWVPHGSKLAWQVSNKCQMCRLRDGKPLKQQMGLFPEDRLKPMPPFTNVMLDLFGPYRVRGEVQKRTTAKAYGVLFVDMVMGAVHLEGVFGYDTCSFLLALSRFVSLRGWPQVIYSDPGSQLKAAERELREAWSQIDKALLVKKGAENGLKWIFGAADSPWNQGLVEALIKSTKRAIHFSVNNEKLSPSEFLTLCSEVANLINERPIGVLPSVDSEISAITPNSLLLGRATAKNPGNWQSHIPKLEDRFHVVRAIIESFWEKWVDLCAPALVVHKKWRTSERNLVPGDVVIVVDKSTHRGEYRLALVKEVFPGQDGKVSKALLTYKNYKVGENVQKYLGAPDTCIIRSVQRLILLVPAQID